MGRGRGIEREREWGRREKILTERERERGEKLFLLEGNTIS